MPKRFWRRCPSKFQPLDTGSKGASFIFESVLSSSIEMLCPLGSIPELMPPTETRDPRIIF